MKVWLADVDAAPSDLLAALPPPACVCADFSDGDAREIKAIEQSTGHDVKAVEYFLRRRVRVRGSCVCAHKCAQTVHVCVQFDSCAELRRVARFLHFACTSEDVNNLAYALMMKSAMGNVVRPHMQHVVRDIRALAHSHAATPMLSLTHGQPATPTTLGKEMANFAYVETSLQWVGVVVRLTAESVPRYRLDLQVQRSSPPIRGKINGAVGNFNAHVVAYPLVRGSDACVGRKACYRQLLNLRIFYFYLKPRFPA